MRYAKLSCTEFYFVIYSNATQLTYSLTRTPGHGQKFSWNWLLSCFFLELSIWQPDFLKIVFFHQNGENRPRPGIFECIGKLSCFSQFFIFSSIWAIMKVYITVILVCLNKFHIWENSGFWDMAQNALGQSDCRIFQSIAGL